MVYYDVRMVVVMMAAVLMKVYDDMRMTAVMRITVFISSQYISGVLYTIPFSSHNVN